MVLGLLVVGLPFTISGCFHERELAQQREKILAFTDAEKAFILDELIRIAASTTFKKEADMIDLDAREVPPPLSFLKPRRMQVRKDSTWLDLGYNFDHGVSLRAQKEQDGGWRLSAELEEFQPEKVLFRSGPNKPLQGTEGKVPSSSTEPEALRP
jgi:hypothetical protein